MLDHQPHAKGKHPLIVTVGYKINSIGEVNSVTACFEVDFKLFVHWEDPAFIGKDKDSVKKASSSKLDPGLDKILAGIKAVWYLSDIFSVGLPVAQIQGPGECIHLSASIVDIILLSDFITGF